MIKRTSLRALAVGLIVAMTPVVSFAALSPGVGDGCGTGMADFTLFQKRQISFDSNNKMKLNETNLAHIKEQRQRLREAVQYLHENCLECDHAVKRLILARMMRTHAFLYGDPGSNKTGISRELLLVLSESPEGKSSLKSFALQMNQQMGDNIIRGYIDNEKVKGNDVSVEHIRNAGTMIHFPTVLIDEIDKGNPVALAAFLDIINEGIAQYGPITIKARTKTIIATSNMTIYEFIEAFKNADMESTARAIIDRLPFKVYMHNYLTTPKARHKLIANATEGHAIDARNWLMNPEEDDYKTNESVVEEFRSKVRAIDFVWFGRLAEAGSDVPKDTQMVFEEIIDPVRAAFYQMRSDSEEELASAGKLGLESPYYPPTIFSNRNIAKHMTRIVPTSILLDLLLLPEEKLPTKDLGKLLEEKIPVDRFSAWRLQDVNLTAAPGDPVLAPQQTGQGIEYKLVYGQEVPTLLKTPFDSRQKKLLTYIEKERDAFRTAFENVIKQNQTRMNQVSQILSLLPIPKGMTVNGIEEYLQLIDPKPVPQSPASSTP